LVRNALLRRVRVGVYALAGSPVTWHQAAMAAVLGGGADSVASHSTAARLWDFRYASDDALEITVPRPFHPAVRGVSVHRSVLLPPADTTRRYGVPCTSFERTLCDQTTELSWLQLGRVLDDGLRRGVTTLDGLAACSARLDSGPLRRLSVVKGLLAQRAEGYDPGGSAAELRLLSVYETAGLPLPEQQVEVRVGRRKYFLDFAWRECKVFAEWYGLPWHVGATAVVRDNARITDLSAAGWRPLVFTDETSDAEIVVATRALLAEVGWIMDRIGA
jgi:hypothetical protein